MNAAASPQDSGLRALREKSSRQLAQMGFPHRREEKWKYTSLDLLNYQAGVTEAISAPLSMEVKAQIRAALDPTQAAVVFINGQLSPELSQISPVYGQHIYGQHWSIAAEGVKDPFIGPLPKDLTLGPQDHFFTVLGGVYLNSAVHMSIESQADFPVQVLHVSHLEESETLPVSGSVCFFHLKKGASASINELHLSLGSSRALHSVRTHLVLEENSRVQYLYWQDCNEAMFHFSDVTVELNRNSQWNSLVISTGSRLSRQTMNVSCHGEGAGAYLGGLYLIGGEQQADHYTEIHHLRPHGFSHQLYKGLLNDRSRAVFAGKIRIHPRAQKVNCSQLNKSMLLKSTAEVDTLPQLEVYADDVKAKHGATIGQYNEEELFYLMSRGLSRQEALRVMAVGFVEDVLVHGPLESLKSVAKTRLTQFFASQKGRALLEGWTQE